MRGSAAPFDLGGDGRGVLCLHGFTGTPFEMRYLGERLHERGFTVVGPALPGHASTPAELDATTWTDWSAGVAAAFDRLRERCAQVAVVGQSLGGLLALHLARERGDQVAAVASLAAPLWLPRAARGLLRLLDAVPALRRVVPLLPKPGGSDIRDRAMGRQNPAYPVLPLRALAQLDAFTRVVRADLPHVRTPTLIVHARHDHTAPFAGSAALVAELGAASVRRRVLARSYHLVALDVERDQVAADVGRFFEAQLAAGVRAAV